MSRPHICQRTVRGSKIRDQLLLKSARCNFQRAEPAGYKVRGFPLHREILTSRQERDTALPNLKIDPLLKSLHQDPPYADLVRKMRL